MGYFPQRSHHNRPGRFLPGPSHRPDVGVEFRSSVAGFFTATLLDAKAFRERGEEVVRRRLHFQNLVTDAGLNRVCNMGNQVRLSEVLVFCWVGTGSTAPAVTDTDLVGYLAETQNDSGFSEVDGYGPVGGGPGGAPEYVSRTVTRVFLEGEANGNLTEVAMAENAHAGGPTMWTRQLFLDEFSVPTTIVKTSAELLKIEYEVRVYIPTAVVTQLGETIGVQSIDVAIQPIRADTGYWQALLQFGSSENIATAVQGYTAWAYEDDTDYSADFKSNPSTTSGVPNSSKGFVAYVGGSFQAKVQHVWDLGDANFATGIGSLQFGNVVTNSAAAAPWYMRFSPKIAKTSSDKLTMEISYTLARH